MSKSKLIAYLFTIDIKSIFSIATPTYIHCLPCLFVIRLCVLNVVQSTTHIPKQTIFLLLFPLIVFLFSLLYLYLEKILFIYLFASTIVIFTSSIISKNITQFTIIINTYIFTTLDNQQVNFITNTI